MAATALTLADISGLVSRIESVERALSTYIRTESAVQETKNVQRVLDKVHTYLPTVSAIATDLRFVYLPSGSLLTDLDGCIVISTKPPKPGHRNTYKNNTLGFNPSSDFARTLLLESKHSLTKGKIDTKLVQMCKLKGLLASLPELDVSTTSTPFRAMIEDHALHTYPSFFYIVFAADDMTYSIRNFLMAISEGISKEVYDRYTLLFMKEDPFYKTIKRNPSIPKRLKTALHAARTAEDVVTVLADAAFDGYRPTLSRIVQPYDAIVPYYNEMRGRVGFLQFNTLFIPDLFPYPMMNSLRAW